MSNVIKSYSVRYDVAMKTIDTHLREDKQVEQRRIFSPAPVNREEPQEGFVEGLSALVVEEFPSEEDTSNKADTLIELTQNKANSIIEAAKNEAESIKREAFETAQKAGYENGMNQAREEILRLETEYKEKARLLQEEYDQMILSFEPQMAQIIADMVEKMTGILAQDKEEIILHLIQKAITNVDRSKEYTIRVSEEDYDFVSMQSHILVNALEIDAPLYITKDTSLSKNQCLIETDLHVINCSLDVQLNNLVTDLKLIGSI